MKKLLALSAVSLLFLAACGDSSDGSDPLATADGSPPPAAQNQSGGGGGGEHAGHGGGGGGATAAHGNTDCSPSGTNLTLTISGGKVDKGCLAVPAGQAFTLVVENKDPNPHGIALLASHTAVEPIARTDIFSGPKSVTLNVPAMQAGTYIFHDEVDRNNTGLQGSLVVK